MAYWGLAVNYLGNSLARLRRPKDMVAAVEALDKARAIGPRPSASVTGSTGSASTTATPTRCR
jgi:hypothetical protein